jgi:4-cresol dehydrogenase (hydroxylating)
MIERDTALQSALSSALTEWRAAIGAAHVVVEPSALEQAGTATFNTSARVTAIIRPGSCDDVQQCVRIANRYSIPLYPISTGKNWGYGSRAPVRDGILLELGRLNRIVDFSEPLAYVTVEPGVTQGQLYDFLQRQRSKLWMDATGSSVGCSVIGNTLERGFGHTPMGDHCSHVCGFQVVLPTGDIVETGFSRFPHARAGALSRWGVGPSLDGLFSQSNLGIVTRMTVWLMPAPECFQAFVFQSDRPLAPIIDALRPLRIGGTLRGVMHIGNDYKVLSGTERYPWTETGGRIPLDEQTMARLRQEMGISKWSASGGLYGTRGQVREARTLLRRALAGKVDRLQFVGERKLALLRRIEAPYRRITGRTDLQRALIFLPPLLDVLQGTPTDGFLASSYWRKKTTSQTLNPDVDRCGLLWCSPVAPLCGEDVTAVTDLAREIALRHGFEPLISISLISERMTISTVALTYDREIVGEDARALACYQELMERLTERGYPSYRLNVASMHYGDAGGSEYRNAVRAIKAALDPNGILAPGRYE